MALPELVEGSAVLAPSSSSAAAVAGGERGDGGEVDQHPLTSSSSSTSGVAVGAESLPAAPFDTSSPFSPSLLNTSLPAVPFSQFVAGKLKPRVVESVGEEVEAVVL